MPALVRRRFFLLYSQAFRPCHDLPLEGQAVGVPTGPTLVTLERQEANAVARRGGMVAPSVGGRVLYPLKKGGELAAASCRRSLQPQVL